MDGAAAYLDALHHAWERRATTDPSASVQVEVAGWRIEIDATPAPVAAALAGAFDPLRAPARAPDLHVRVAMGGLPPVPRGTEWQEHDRLHFDDGQHEIHVAAGAPLSALDHDTSRAVCWFPGPELPYWERAAPLRAILAWFAVRRDTLLLHAAAVGEDDRAVLLVGPGGAGKTTTALAAWTAGMDYLGDDYVLVRVGPEARTARAYATAKAASGTLALLPSLAPWLASHAPPAPPGDRGAASDDKAVLRLAGAPGLEVVDAEIAAVVVPRIGPDAGLQRVAPGHALRAAAPSSLYQLPYDRERAFPLLAEVVRRAPCYVLDTGSDPIVAASMVRELLRSGDRVTS
jgi:hypothetical protein